MGEAAACWVGWVVWSFCFFFGGGGHGGRIGR